jgi:septum formation protein
MDFRFEVRTQEVLERYPPYLSGAEVAQYLALKKAKAVAFRADNELIIGADTIVVGHGNEILGKPASEKDAIAMLELLSGKSHEVITGVAMRSKQKELTFAEHTKVVFSRLDKEEMQYYLKHYPPMDKAGGYGIQDWIGHIGIERIEGCYYNVVGFPCSRFFRELKQWTI